MNRIYLSVKTLIGKIRNVKLSVTVKTPFVNFSFVPAYIKPL